MVVGLDVSPRMIELAKTLATQLRQAQSCLFLNQNLLDYQTQKSFDGVIALGFFDYIADPCAVLRRIRGLTAGQLVASFPALFALRVPFRKAWLASRGCPVRFYTGHEVRTLCGKAGFACKSLIRKGPIYLLAATPVGDTARASPTFNPVA